MDRKSTIVALVMVNFGMLLIASHMYSFGIVFVGCFACCLFGALIYALTRYPTESEIEKLKEEHRRALEGVERRFEQERELHNARTEGHTRGRHEVLRHLSN